MLFYIYLLKATYILLYFPCIIISSTYCQLVAVDGCFI